jgi:hypothetical protein
MSTSAHDTECTNIASMLCMRHANLWLGRSDTATPSAAASQLGAAPDQHAR